MNPFPTRTLQLGATLAFFTMAMVGWKLADEAEIPSAEQSGIVTRSADRPARVSRGSGPPDRVRQQVAALRAIGSPDDRLRATIALARSIPLSEIPAWLEGRWFPSGGGFDLMLFNKLLKERWQREDPGGLLAWEFKNNSAQAGSTLISLARNDPQAALRYLEDHPFAELENQVLAEIAKVDPALALKALAGREIAGDYGSGMGSYYLRQLLDQLAKSSPAALEGALASLPANLRSVAETALIKDRMATAFDTEIRKLWERPDGWKIFEQIGSQELNQKLFGELANLPPAWRNKLASYSYRFVDAKDAEKWIHADLEGFGFNANQAKNLRGQALSALGQQSPETALKLMADMDLDPSHRLNLITNLFANLGNKKDQADALLALLGSDEERARAREGMAVYQSLTGSAAKKIEEPADWLAQVAAPDAKSGLSSSYQSIYILRSWDAAKIDALRSEFLALPGEQKREVAKVLAQNNGYAANIQSLQGEALRYLIANPEPKPATPDPSQIQQLPNGMMVSPAAAGNATIGQASAFAVHWAQADPAAASEWVQSLPAGDAKLWAQKNLAANWVQVDPDATDRWLATLPAADRSQVQQFLDKKPASGAD